MSATRDGKAYDGTTTRAPRPRPAVRHRQRELTQGYQRRTCSGPTEAPWRSRACRRRQRGPGLHHQLRLGARDHHAGALTLSAPRTSGSMTARPPHQAPRPPARCSAPTARASPRATSRRTCSGPTEAPCWLGQFADGNGGADYTISNVSANGTITPAPLTVTAVGDCPGLRRHDFSTATPTVGPVFGNDSASLTQAFQRRTCSARTAVCSTPPAGSPTAMGGRDYTISSPAKGTITPAALTVTAVGDSRVYDGTILRHRAPRPSARCSAPTARASRRPSSRRMCSARTAARCWPRAVSPTATGAGITPSASSRPRAPSRRPR